MKYFRVLADPKSADRWFLDEPIAANHESLDARDFTQGKNYLGPDPVIVPVQRDGSRVPFNFAAFDMPVLSKELVDEIIQLAPDDIVSYPALINATIPGFEIVNVVSTVKCLDEEKSEIQWWKPEDGRPDKVGHYRMVTKLRIAPALVQARHIFRIKGWEIALIVSEQFRDRVAKFGPLGVVFQPV